MKLLDTLVVYVGLFLNLGKPICFHRPKPYDIGFDQGMHCADCKVMLPDNTPTHKDFQVKK